MSYEPIRETDVFWKNVWRVIDLREKLNLHFKWPQHLYTSIIKCITRRKNAKYIVVWTMIFYL